MKFSFGVDSCLDAVTEVEHSDKSVASDNRVGGRSPSYKRIRQRHAKVTMEERLMMGVEVMAHSQ